MKKFFAVFFIIMGVIFSILLVVGAFLFVLDPWGIKPLFFGGVPTETIPSQAVKGEDSAGSKKYFLSDSQKATIASYGIDPAILPSSITVQQETCLKSKLGEARFTEIVNGGSPTAVDFFSAKSCF